MAPKSRFDDGPLEIGRRQRIMMRVKVKFSGLFYSIAGVEEDIVDIEDGGTVSHVIEVIGQKYTDLPLQDGQTFFMVDNKIARRDQILSEGDRVIMLRMLAGG